MSAAGLVVVGASIAGTTAARAAREAGWEGPVTLVDPEPGAYSRPPLSKGVLTGAETMASIELPDPADVRVLRGRHVVAWDDDTCTVMLGDGERIRFDAMIVATGARARAFGVPGEHTVRDREDVARLSAALYGPETVIVVGGGLLGAELASAVSSLGHRVVFAARRPPLHDALGTFLSEEMCRAARDHGIRVLIDPALRVTGHGDTAEVRIRDEVLPTRALVTAIGDLPNTEWCTERGGAVAVDRTLRTGERVWGAGDAVAVDGAPRTPHWHAAIQQGRLAGRNAAHWLMGRAHDEALVPDRYLWTEAFGLKLKIAGPPPGAGAPEIFAGAWAERSAVLRWAGRHGASAVSVNHRMPVPRLRALADPTLSPTPDTSKEMP